MKLQISIYFLLKYIFFKITFIYYLKNIKENKNTKLLFLINYNAIIYKNGTRSKSVTAFFFWFMFVCVSLTRAFATR